MRNDNKQPLGNDKDEKTSQIRIKRDKTLSDFVYLLYSSYTGASNWGERRLGFCSNRENF